MFKVIYLPINKMLANKLIKKTSFNINLKAFKLYLTFKILV
jgi:hypothetical protein